MKKRTKSQIFFQHGYLLRLLISRDIKKQYYRSILGFLWTILNPLLNMLVMAFVFSEIFGRDMRGGLDYAVYVLSGSLIYGLMVHGSNSGLTSFTGNSGMLQKTKVSMWIFPMSSVLSAFVSFCFSFTSLIVVMLVRMPKGVEFHWEMFAIILMLPSLILFTIGMAFILSCIYVFFRDMRHIYDVTTTIWRYLTPIFYPITKITNEKVLFVIKLNPMFHYVEYVRSTLLGEMPSVTEHLICYGFGIGLLLIGILVLKLTKNKIVSRL